MLENNILATNMIYITIFHKQENIKKYLKVFEKFFLIFQTKISKKFINLICVLIRLKE